MDFDEDSLELHATDHYTRGALDGCACIELRIKRDMALSNYPRDVALVLQELLKTIGEIELDFKVLRHEEYLTMRTEAAMSIEPKPKEKPETIPKR